MPVRVRPSTRHELDVVDPDVLVGGHGDLRRGGQPELPRLGHQVTLCVQLNGHPESHIPSGFGTFRNPRDVRHLATTFVANRRTSSRLGLCTAQSAGSRNGSDDAGAHVASWQTMAVRGQFGMATNTCSPPSAGEQPGPLAGEVLVAAHLASTQDERVRFPPPALSCPTFACGTGHLGP